MNILIGILLSILPLSLYLGLMVVWKFKKDVLYRTLIASVLGGLCAAIGLFIESTLVSSVLLPENWLGVIIESFAFTSLVEEGLKFLALLVIVKWIYPHLSWTSNHLAAIGLALGFGLVENSLYSIRFEPLIILLRTFTSLISHLCFAIVMAHYMIRYVKGSHRHVSLLLSLIVPIGLHGLYDVFIIQAFYEPLMLLSIILIIPMSWFCYHLFKQSILHDLGRKI